MAYDLSNFQLTPGGPVYSIQDQYIDNLIKNFPEDNPYIHNAIPRNVSIQKYFDDGTLYDRIYSGTFEDLFIGDWWNAGYGGVNMIFRIAGFDTLIGTGDTQLTTHHAVIVPDESFELCMMNKADTTVGGYKGSYANKTVIGDPATSGGTSTVNQKLYSTFGRHLLTTRELLTTSVDADATAVRSAGGYGSSNGWEWTSCQAILMSEVELLGTHVAGSSALDDGVSNMQLPLFRTMPYTINYHSYNMWLRSISHNGYFCMCGENHYLATGLATRQCWVRPRFVID